MELPIVFQLLDLGFTTVDSLQKIKPSQLCLFYFPPELSF